MAFRRRIGQLANTLLADHLARTRAEEESQLVGQRQQELSRQASEQQLTQKLLTDPKALAEYLKSGRTSIGNIDLRPMMPKREDAIQATSAAIEKPKNLNETLTPQGVINDFNSQPGAQAVAPGPTQIDPTTTGQLRLDMGDKTGRNLLKPNPSAINGLLDQNFAKRTSMENAAAPVEQEAIDPNTGVATKQLVNPYKAVGGQARPTERTATEQGNRDATIADYQEPGKVRTAGKEAGARAAAELPFQTKLAQVRADTSLLEQQKLDEWRAAHPKATADQLNQRAGAAHALTMIDEVQQLMDEMDKRGMMGALVGRGSDIAADRIKSEDLFKNPQDAQLAAEFFSQAGFLNKLAQKVHAGTRGAASPMMAAQFEKLFSGVGDKSIVQGQLNVVKRVMQTYADNPDAPPLLVIPGMEPGRNPAQPLVLDPSIKALLDRGVKR